MAGLEARVERMKEEQKKQGFGGSSKPRSGHRSRVFLPEKAQPVSNTITSGISVNDYLVLLKSLCINLPNGVLNQKVIRLSENAGIIQKAQDIVKQLENFKFQFNSIPRLGCRELRTHCHWKTMEKSLNSHWWFSLKKEEIQRKL